MSDKEPGAFRTISEVATELDLPPHVLRFWETKFSQIRPMKRSSGRRFYRPEDVALVRTIRHMLYDQGYTIRGVQRVLKERGVKGVLANAGTGALPPTVAEVSSGEAEQARVVDAATSEETTVADLDRALPAGMADELRAMAGELRECAQILSSARTSEAVSPA